MYNDFTDTVSAGLKGGRLKETKCQESSNPLGQVEDEIMKTGAQFFGEELLKWLGIKEPVKRIAPTELVHLETRKMYQDFNYEMENGWWYHIEFESDPLTKADLRRFREYEAATSRTYGVEVLTCVICTANRKHIGGSSYLCDLYRKQKAHSYGNHRGNQYLPGQTDTNEEKRRGQNPEENTKEEKAEKERSDPGAAQPSYGRQFRDQNQDIGRNQGS